MNEKSLIFGKEKQMKSDWKFRPLLNLIDFLNWKELNFII